MHVPEIGMWATPERNFPMAKSEIQGIDALLGGSYNVASNLLAETGESVQVIRDKPFKPSHGQRVWMLPVGSCRGVNKALQRSIFHGQRIGRETVGSMNARMRVKISRFISIVDVL